MGEIWIDFAPGKNCWNILDSYGYMRCVGCGCCSKDKRTRYEARIRCLERWLKELYEFDMWVDEWRETQEKNIKKDIRYFKRQLRYYMKKLAEMAEEE